VVPPENLIVQVQMPEPPKDSPGTTNMDLIVYIEALYTELRLQDSANKVLRDWITLQR